MSSRARAISASRDRGWLSGSAASVARYARVSSPWPALREIALIVRGADTERLELAPQAAGLLAISLGLSRNFGDDHEQLRHGFVLYDALYSWSRYVREERHTWNPQRTPPG